MINEETEKANLFVQYRPKLHLSHHLSLATRILHDAPSTETDLGQDPTDFSHVNSVSVSSQKTTDHNGYDTCSTRASTLEDLVEFANDNLELNKDIFNSQSATYHGLASGDRKIGVTSDIRNPHTVANSFYEDKEVDNRIDTKVKKFDSKTTDHETVQHYAKKAKVARLPSAGAINFREHTNCINYHILKPNSDQPVQNPDNTISKIDEEDILPPSKSRLDLKAVLRGPKQPVRGFNAFVERLRKAKKLPLCKIPKPAWQQGWDTILGKRWMEVRYLEPVFEISGSEQF